MADRIENPILKIDGDFWVISPHEINSVNIAVQFIKKYWSDNYNIIIYDRTSKSTITIISSLKVIGAKNIERMLQGILSVEDAIITAIGQGIKQKCFVLTTSFKQGTYKTPLCYMWNGLKLVSAPVPDSINTESADFWEKSEVHPVYKVKPIKVKAKKAGVKSKKQNNSTSPAMKKRVITRFT